MKTPLKRTAYSNCLLLVGCLVACCLTSLPGFASEPEKQPFALHDGQTVLFLGDSITYGDMYIQYLDAYLYTRYPDWKIKLVNRGIPSETCAGTSEPTHNPPRPDVHTRLDRTLKAVKPDVVFICYGMNDGVYHSPHAKVLQKYQTGMTRLVHRVREETKAEVIVLTPPPFDHRAFANKVRPADQAEPDYRFPAQDYDQTLASFTAWLMTQRAAGLKVPVIDLHTQMAKILKERRKSDDDFRLARDGIHPGPTGHWLMAQTILAGLNARRDTEAKLVKADSESGAEFTWKNVPLPLPLDPRIDADVLALAHSRQWFPTYRLTVEQLAAGEVYELKVADQAFGEATMAELKQGVRLANDPNFPLNKTSQKVLSLVQQRRQVLRDVWIMSDPSPRLAGERERLLKTSKSTTSRAAALDAKIRQLCQPADLKISVRLEGMK